RRGEASGNRPQASRALRSIDHADPQRDGTRLDAQASCEAWDGYPAEVGCPRRSRQCHQNTTTIARTAAAITTKTKAKFSIHAMAGNAKGHDQSRRADLRRSLSRCAQFVASMVASIAGGKSSRV